MEHYVPWLYGGQQRVVPDLLFGSPKIVDIGLGFLNNAEERRGRPARLEIADPMPEDNEILPSVERLRGCTIAGDWGGFNLPCPRFHLPT